MAEAMQKQDKGTTSEDLLVRVQDLAKYFDV